GGGGGVWERGRETAGLWGVRRPDGVAFQENDDRGGGWICLPKPGAVHERRTNGHLRAGRRDRPRRPQSSGQAQLLQSDGDAPIARSNRSRRRGSKMRHHLRPWRQLLRRAGSALGGGELEERALGAAAVSVQSQHLF